MSWRRVPPVHSPIAPDSLLAAIRAAAVSRGAADGLAADIASRFEARDAILTDSGTSALVLALRAMVPENGVVALPGYVCIDVIAAAVRARVRVQLYDVDPETLSPDLDSLRAVLTAGARAVVVAPLYGYPPDMRRIAELAADHGVPLIEDAAQGAGGRLDGRRLGAFGDLSVLSFGRGKGTTAGSGGALLFRGPRSTELARDARKELGSAARGVSEIVALAAQWVLARPGLYSIPASIPSLKLGEMVYRVAREPREISAAGAAILQTALELDDAEVRSRSQRAAALLTVTSRSARYSAIRALAGASPGYLRLALMDVRDFASARPHMGVMRGYPITLDQHPETRPLLVDSQPTLPGARLLRDRLFTVPTHSRVGVRDLARLTEWLGSPSTEETARPLRANAAREF